MLTTKQCSTEYIKASEYSISKENILANSKKSDKKINFINIKNNYVLPFPHTVYSTNIDDKATITRLRKYVLNGESKIALRFTKPSFVGEKKEKVKFTVSANKLRSIVHEKFFKNLYLANIISVKPIGNRLLCLFDIIDIFYIDPMDFKITDGEGDIEYIEKLEIPEESITTHSKRNEALFNDLSEDEKNDIGRLYDTAFDLALRQGINFYDSASESFAEEGSNIRTCENYLNFLYFCIPFLSLSEEDYEKFIEPGRFREKFEFIVMLLSMRLHARKLESDNNKKIDDEIRGYSKTLANWKRTVKNLETLNVDIAENGLDSINKVMERNQSDPDAFDSDGSGQLIPENISEDDARRLFEKLTGQELPPNAEFSQPPFLPGIGIKIPRKKSQKGKKETTFFDKYMDEHVGNSRTQRYIDFVNALDASDEIKEEICSEIMKIETNPMQQGADYNTSVDWLETILKIPFNQYTSEDYDLDTAKKIIDESHYGMKDVKKRIFEFLSLRQISSEKNGAIICLVGPPGVGKTSIASSIAQALGRKYFRFSAGGVRDEAEFIGHRRTYVAAQPGKIIQGLSSTKVMNPVFLIDEVDKLSTNSHSRSQGDVSSTLLNILDSDQNKNFTDLYLNFPLDLSKVIFILTANDISEMPAPLLDRMEVIEVPSYTSNEKIHIVKDYLLKKIAEKLKIEHKVTFGKIKDEDIRYIIECYTKEAGVRGIKTELEKLIRGQLDADYSPDKAKYKIDFSKENVQKHLGTEKYDPNEHLTASIPGTSIGLAWTALGGCAMKIEVVAVPEGKGELKITGQLGDVMKESVNIAFSYLHSIATNNKFFTKNDFHLHIPEGATPKDGPSAGITILCAFYSLYSSMLIKKQLAMTGELNLSGEVLPIGGLKEKLYAAKTNGMKDVLIPFKNMKDLNDIDDEIKTGLNIIPVKTAKEVLENSFKVEGVNVKLFARQA